MSAAEPPIDVAASSSVASSSDAAVDSISQQLEAAAVVPEQAEPDRVPAVDISQASAAPESLADKVNLVRYAPSLLAALSREATLLPGHDESPDHNEFRFAARWENLFPSDNPHLAQLLRGVQHKGFIQPSTVQKVTLPLTLRGLSIVASSQAGTGKTACFVLSALSRVNVAIKKPQVLILAPTRSLCVQLHDEVYQMGAYVKDLKATLFTGNLVPNKSDTIDAQVIVGTGATVVTAIKANRIPTSHIRVIILDEADYQLKDEGGSKLGDIRHLFGPKFAHHDSVQWMLFSATFPPAVREKMRTLNFPPNASIIDIHRPNATAANVAQFRVQACSTSAHDLRIKVCKKLLQLNFEQAIVFVNSKTQAADLFNALKDDPDFKGRVSTFSSNLPRPAQDRLIDEFRNQSIQILIATNALGRGVDFPSIGLVINFDIPSFGGPYGAKHQPDFESYIHRVGRTGRANNTGVAVSLWHNDSDRELLNAIQQKTGDAIEVVDCVLQERDGRILAEPEMDLDAVTEQLRGRAARLSGSAEARAQLIASVPAPVRNVQVIGGVVISDRPALRH